MSAHSIRLDVLPSAPGWRTLNSKRRGFRVTLRRSHCDIAVAVSPPCSRDHLSDREVSTVPIHFATEGSPTITLSTHTAASCLPAVYDVFNAVWSERIKRGSNNGNRRRHRRRSLPNLPSQRSHQRLASLRPGMDRLRPHGYRQLLTRLPRRRSPQAHHAPTPNPPYPLITSSAALQRRLSNLPAVAARSLVSLLKHVQTNHSDESQSPARRTPRSISPLRPPFETQTHPITRIIKNSNWTEFLPRVKSLSYSQRPCRVTYPPFAHSSLRPARSHPIRAKSFQARIAASLVFPATYTHSKHTPPQPSQSKPLAHSLKNIGGVPLFFPN